MPTTKVAGDSAFGGLWDSFIRAIGGENASLRTRETVGAAITVVGVLVPATILVARLGNPPPGSLSTLFVADLWLAVSLPLGLYVL